MGKFASADLKIILDGLKFNNSFWIFSGVNVEIINCDAVSLVLTLHHLKHAFIQNCTFGNWTFRSVQNAFIKNCNIVFHGDISTSLDFLNSSAYIGNITMENKNITGDGIFVYNYSFLHVEQSTFVNNTVRSGIIKILKSSSLIMSNCTVWGNYATYYAGVIYTRGSFVYLKNTYFNNNVAINGGGAIFIENMSFLQTMNCTFKNNSVDRTFGNGGAILSLNYSILDLSYSIFDHNKAHAGSAIQQQFNSKMKLNQCPFFKNSETAIVGLYSSQVCIINSIFENNLAKLTGGAVIMGEKSVLIVSNTTFENNVQISASTLNLYQTLYDDMNKGKIGGAIYLSESVANISESWFHDNSASYCCGSIAALFNSSLSISNTTFVNNFVGVFGGAICSENSFINIEYSKFINNSVLNNVYGMGGGLYLTASAVKISNVLLSKCDASVGAAISSNSTTITMSSSSVTANMGSAINLSNGHSLKINNCTFSNNSAHESGGAVVCEACTVKIVNTRFSHNSELDGGGAVLAECQNVNTHNSSFTHNTAYRGGAMSISTSNVSISDNKFSHNLATKGGAVDLTYGYLVITNCQMCYIGKIMPTCIE